MQGQVVPKQLNIHTGIIAYNLYFTMAMKPGLELIMLCILAQVDLSQSSPEFKS